MTRSGFKRTWAAGAFDAAAVAALYGHIADTLTATGFVVAASTATSIDVLRSGAAVDASDDDTPHWQIFMNDVYLIAAPVKAGGSQQVSLASPMNGYPSPIVVHFAADSRDGWWWLHIAAQTVDSPSGYRHITGSAGTSLRRHPIDLHQGLVARFGVFNINGRIALPFVREASTGNAVTESFDAWTPLGLAGNNGTGIRHVGSPMPRMAVPIYPAGEVASASVLGEMDAVMLLTDGYAMEEAPMPGWVAMPGDTTYPQCAYAFPAPASFTPLP